MSLDKISTNLRKEMDKSDLPLSLISRRTGVSYSKLRRFHKDKKPLSLEELSSLSKELTGLALEICKVKK